MSVDDVAHGGDRAPYHPPAEARPPAAFRRIDVHPVSPALGAEVTGVNLAGSLGDDVVEELHIAFLSHLVLFFRDQSMTPDDLVRLARRFGELDRYPFVRGMDEQPDVVEVIKREDEAINFGGLWHTDTSYLPRPPKASILYARRVPPVGGDTLFANMYLAYDALSDALRHMLSPLKGYNSATRASAASTRVHRIDERPTQGVDVATDATHPLVRTHPESGRKALYCSDAHTVNIEGMTEAESAPLLQYLYTVQQRPEFTCRFRWQPGSVAFWDNRCTQHNALNDYAGFRREMLRVTLAGDVPA